jgi:hypothetical protein
VNRFFALGESNKRHPYDLETRMAKTKVGITDRHYVSLGQISTAQNTLTAYGKLVKDSEVPASTAGISHPHGLDEPLQAGLVFGVAIGGRCITLPSPEQVMLPAPDGPADGCGWDPTKYVVWKNLPKDWTTTHLQSQPKPLISALTAATGKLAPRAMAAAAPFGIHDRTVAVVQEWAHMPSAPADPELLKVLWAKVDPAIPFQPDGTTTVAATSLLIVDLKREFQNPPARFINIQPSDIDPGNIKTVGDLATAVRQST